MAQLQWLGQMPRKREDDMSYVAEAIKGGTSAYLEGREKAFSTRLKSREVGVQESELAQKGKKIEYDYAKLDYDKRKDAYDTMAKLLPSLPPEKQQELTTSPEWTKLEDSLGLPNLSSSTMSNKPEPGWSNVEKVAAVRENLTRRRVGPKRDMFGISEAKDLSTEQDAIDYITEEGLDPSQFKAELAGYVASSTTDKKQGKGRKSPYKEYPDAFLEGGVWKVNRNGKKYKIQD